MKVVAALYVQGDGCYANQPYIDAWPEERDARTYNGTLPVVAHPPCQRWGRMAPLVQRVHGYQVGDDAGCFAAAFEAVNRCGGVLEHPARSYAFQAHGIAAPSKQGWARSGRGWVCEVWQAAYGHKANKATWLYYAGRVAPFELRWERPRGTHQIGGRVLSRDGSKHWGHKPRICQREAKCNARGFPR